jgi:hypothetical protein
MGLFMREPVMTEPNMIGRGVRRGTLMSVANRWMAKRWLTKLLVLGCGIGVSLAIAEGIVRLGFPHSRDMVIPGHLFVVDDELGWKFSSGRSSIHRTRHFAVEYVINASGFRDRSRPDSRSSRMHRILLYGDSLVFGWGVPQADRFSDVLEKRMGGLEVWNHAVPGYGLDQEVLSYERDAESLPFDEAMFFVARGTLQRIHAGYIYAKYKPVFSYSPDGGLKVKPIPTVKNRVVSLLYEMFSPLYLPYFLQNEVAIFKETFAAGMSVEKRISGEPKHMGTLAKEILQRARATTRRKNQRMSVLVGDIWSADREDLRRFCEQNNIDFLEVPADISATSMSDDRMDLVLGWYDRHWNAKANLWIADQLEKQIRSYQLLSKAIWK